VTIHLTEQGAAQAIVAAGVIVALAIVNELRRQRRVHREILQRKEKGAQVRQLVADTIEEAHVQAALARRGRQHG
jgi:hypothetical protein